MRRKAREFVLSLAVEIIYSKNEILEFYLNQVPYGGTAYGLESAARTYFGKSASELTLAESALLAGLPQAPSYYSPFGSAPQRAKDRQRHVLSQMLDNKFISQQEYDGALGQELLYSRQESLNAPHFSLWVKDMLIQKYGLDRVEQDGLTVITTLDLELQDFAQSAVASEVAKLKKEKVSNGAALVTHPKTGEILAMVGSKDYFDTQIDGNVNVVLASRQPGSSIKPIHYALGLDHKIFTAASLLADKPTCFSQANQKPYCPDNYDGQFHGPTQVRFALANSFNIPAVKALTLTGLTDFVATSSAFGITSYKDPQAFGPSLALGGGEVTMLDLAVAYGVLANAGTRVDLNPILKVMDRAGTVLEQVPSTELSDEDSVKTNLLNSFRYNHKSYVKISPPNTRVISSGAAFIISHILYDNGARSATFGSSSYLNIKNHPEVSVKTGTTNEKRDNWTVGFTPDIEVAVWVGNNDNTAMSYIASGVTGASPIWNKIMSRALTDYSQHWPPQPADVTGTTVCSLSGYRTPESPPADCSPRYEYFLKGTFPPPDPGQNRRDISIYKSTQAPATARQIAEEPQNIEPQNHAVLFDALGTALCLDCSGGYGGPDVIRLDSSGKAIKQ